MSVLIRNAQVEADDYGELPDDADAANAARRVIVSLARWQAERASLLPHFDAVGVRLLNTVDLSTIWQQVADRPLIELDFPAFGDGRAYSQARLLRDRYGFPGEIRARGKAVVRDQIQSMVRAGINSFVLRDDQITEQCLAALNDFKLAYQYAVDDLPIAQKMRRHAPPSGDKSQQMPSAEHEATLNEKRL